MPLYFTKKLFDKHSVSVSGAKGAGKDMLFANVIARRKAKYYISNTDYCLKRKKWLKLNLQAFMTGNNYNNFIRGQLKFYIHKYPDKVDVYLADCGIYFPAQYNGELNRDYKEFPTFMALSRQLGECYVHTNCQAPNRVWDKIREQSDRFVQCLWCRVLFGKIVIQKIRIYERYDSYVSQIQPFRSAGGISKDRRNSEFEQRVKYINTHGKINERILIYWNKSRYNTRMFRDLLAGGEYDKK